MGSRVGGGCFDLPPHLPVPAGFGAAPFKNLASRSHSGTSIRAFFRLARSVAMKAFFRLDRSVAMKLVAKSLAWQARRERRARRALVRRLWHGRSTGAILKKCEELGDLWMWLQLMWLQFVVVRGPVAVVCGRFGAGLGPNRPQIDPKRHRPDFGQPQIAAT